MNDITGSISSQLKDTIASNIASLVDRYFKAAIEGSKDIIGSAATNMKIGFERYVATNLTRCSSVKTLVSPAEPVSIDEAYEPVSLKIGGHSIKIEELILGLSGERRNALITATLGSGKSFTMKYIYRHFATREIDKRIPIFIELRLVEFSEQSILNYVSNALSVYSPFATEKEVISGLKSGAFAFVMDGFDEIALRYRRIAEKQINKLSTDYPDNIFVVSSRPDSARFIGWHSFPEYSIEPLNIERLQSLIKRINFDEDEKTQFLAKIQKTLFKTHKNILENPLLASMMLLTFREFQDVPSKMHVFYGTAFDVLYRRHDATKPGYQREFQAGLDLSDFKRGFMTFCFMSYLDKVHSFKSESFLRYAKKSLSYEEIAVDGSNLLHDLDKNVCIMQTEGDEISFIHRSFQEYFAALFLSKRSLENTFGFIDYLLTDQSAQEFASMLIEIDPEEFERKYLIRKMKVIESGLASREEPLQKAAYLSSTYAVARIVSEGENKLPSGLPATMFIPISVRTKKDPKPVNTSSVIYNIAEKYDLPMYSCWMHGTKGWDSNLPVLGRLGRGFAMAQPSDLSKAFVKKSGLEKYFGILGRELKRRIRELEEKHARKAKSLSDLLRVKPQETKIFDIE